MRWVVTKYETEAKISGVVVARNAREPVP